MKPVSSIKRKLFLSHFFAIICITGTITAIFYGYALNNVERQLKIRLQSTAAILGCDFDAADLVEIESKEDISRPEYERTLGKLRTYKASNSDIAFLYIMKLRGPEVVFIVDSDSSEEQAMPGYVYNEVTKEMMAGFAEPSVDSEMVEDEWGIFISGYAPILNGEGEYLIGVDMRDTEVSKQLAGIRRGVGVSIFLAIVLSWLVSDAMATHFRRPIDALIDQVEAIRAGDLESEIQIRSNDEMDTLITAINRMSGDLKASREENLKAAESLRSSLDQGGENRKSS